MNSLCRFLIAFSLLFIFAAKLSLPVFIDHKNIFTTDTEEQTEKSSEKDNAGKSSLSGTKTEVAEVKYLNYAFSFLVTGSSVYRSVNNHHPVLQFCSVPTPPPWFKI